MCIPKYLYFNLTTVHLLNSLICVSQEFGTHDFTVNLHTHGEFYSLVFNNLLSLHMKEFYCSLFCNLSTAVFLITLVITVLKKNN